VVTASPQVGTVLGLFPLEPDLSRVLWINHGRTLMGVVGENGERVTLLQKPESELYLEQVSPDGRWAMYASDLGTFLIATDGKSPAVRFSEPMDRAYFDRTSHFVLGRQIAGRYKEGEGVWKVWNVEAPGNPGTLAPAGFAVDQSVFWIP
jgi:hypothetical protein